MAHIYVTATRCPLMARPAWSCEQVDELLLGWRAEVLEEGPPGWVRVVTDYRYEGWAPVSHLSACGDGANFFAALPKQVVLRWSCPVLAAPEVRAWTVAEGTRGALLAPLGPAGGDGWVRAALPGGGIGYTKCSFLGKFHNNVLPDEASFRRGVVRAAMAYLGAPYRWGGKSPLGLDCSGLAFMAYWLNGVTICRDARLEPGFPLREIPRAGMERGDLLFFPGHVAVYLGGGRYVHATARGGSDGVVVNSLDPASPRYRADLAESLTAVGSLFAGGPRRAAAPQLAAF